jgi:hypothetical protein
LTLLDALPPRRATVGADKGYNHRAFVEGVRARGKTPHVAENSGV